MVEVSLNALAAGVVSLHLWAFLVGFDWRGTMLRQIVMEPYHMAMRWADCRTLWPDMKLQAVKRGLPIHAAREVMWLHARDSPAWNYLGEKEIVDIIWSLR
jgi:hypothetical protein